MYSTQRNGGRWARAGGVGHRAAAARLLAAAAAAGLAAAGPSVRAATYVFDPGGQTPPTTASDGSGNFDATTADFFNTASGALGTFGNTSGDTAVFGSGGTAGTVTVGAVTVGTIDFNQVSGSYLLTGGTINLGSTSPVVAGTITTLAGVTPTIASTINGVNAVFNAPGTLTLTGANTFNNATGSNIAASVATGTVVMGGGVTETFNGELAVGSGTSPAGTAGSPNVATLTINSGTTASSNNNVGLGNTDNNGSSGAYQSLNLNVNGTLKTTGLFFTAYQTAQNTTATINVNSGGNVTAGTFGFGQSAGTTTVVNVASSASLTTTSTGTGSYLGEAAGTNVTLTNNGTVTTNFSIYTNQNGGTNTGAATITNNGTLAVTNGAGGFFNLRLGGNTTINNSGTLTAAGLFFGNAGGAFGTEAVNLTGGTMTLSARSDLNSDAGTGSTGTVNVNISGGVFSDPFYPYLTVLAGQTTTVLQTGGAFNNSSTSGTDGVFFNNGLATYNLAGGILRTNNVGTSGTPTAGSTFIFNGGTLQAQITSTLNQANAFFSPPAAAIGPGGGTIDTQAFNESSVTPIGTLVAGSADGGLTKLGSGTLTMTAANTYTGRTTVNAGALNLSTGGSAGAIIGPLTINAGATVNAVALDAIGYTTGTAVPTLTVNAGGTFNLAADSTNNAANIGNQGFVTNLVLAGGSVTGVDAAGNASGGRFNFSPGFGLTTLASGTTANVSAGIQIRGGATLPITVATGTTPSGVDLLISGSIDDFGQNGAVNKLGPGTLTLTNNAVGSTYTGGTTISAGRVFVNTVAGVAGLGTGAVGIATGATLGGTGNTGSGTVVVAGTITGGPNGTTPGTLTTTAQVWNASGGYLAKVGDTTGSNNDRLVLSGLTIAPGFTVTLAPTTGTTPTFTASSPTRTTNGSQPAGSFIVLATDNESASPFASASTLATLTLVNNGVRPAKAGDSIVLTSEPDGTGTDLILEDVVTAAPEPTSLLLAGGAVVPLALGRRRLRSAAAAV